MSRGSSQRYVDYHFQFSVFLCSDKTHLGMSDTNFQFCCFNSNCVCWQCGRADPSFFFHGKGAFLSREVRRSGMSITIFSSLIIVN